MNDVMEEIINIIFAFIIVIAVTSVIDCIARKIIIWHLKRKYNIKDVNENKMSVKQACKILGIKQSDLNKMSKADLKKIFRNKVQKVHPDHGGSEKDFRNVKEAYDFAYSL